MVITRFQGSKAMSASFGSIHLKPRRALAFKEEFMTADIAVSFSSSHYPAAIGAYDRDWSCYGILARIDPTAFLFMNGRS